MPLFVIATSLPLVLVAHIANAGYAQGQILLLHSLPVCAVARNGWRGGGRSGRLTPCV